MLKKNQRDADVKVVEQSKMKRFKDTEEQKKMKSVLNLTPGHPAPPLALVQGRPVPPPPLQQKAKVEQPPSRLPRHPLSHASWPCLHPLLHFLTADAAVGCCAAVSHCHLACPAATSAELNNN